MSLSMESREVSSGKSVQNSTSGCLDKRVESTVRKMREGLECMGQVLPAMRDEGRVKQPFRVASRRNLTYK